MPKTKKRKVLIDLRFLKNPTNGFGQLSIDYGKYFLENPSKYADLDITLLVPKEYVGHFGPNVHYLIASSKYKLFPFLFPRVDVVHSTTQLLKYTTLRNNTHRIMTIHDIYYLYESNNKKIESKRNRLNARIKLTDTITTISNHTLNDIKKFLATEKKNIHVNYVGVPNISTNKDKKPQCIGSEYRNFLFTIGQLVPRKNFHVLLDVMKIMPEYDLYISGNDDFEYANFIKKRIKDENITNVFITGKITAEEKVWFYKNCEAFIFPSVFEGFGIPVIDAMQFAKPVISSSLTSLGEIGSNHSFYLKNFDPEHVRDTIHNAISAFKKNKELGEDERRYALTYSLEKHMEYYFDLYRSVEVKDKFSLKETIKNYIHYFKV